MRQPDKFKLTVELGNDAMQSPADVADLLRRLARRLDDWGRWQATRDGGHLMDLNGNSVAEWETE